MVLRAVDWLAAPREKGGKYPPNLLDYLNAAAMDRLVPIECRSMLGINPERAGIMLEACVTLVHRAGRRGPLAQNNAEGAGKAMDKLMKQIGS